MSASSAAPNATSAANPSPFPVRYEIRQLTSADLEAATALLVHANMFHSPLWAVVYASRATELALAMTEPSKYLVQHQIDSGLSYGVVDTQYQYKRAESAATGGKLYWDFADTKAAGATLLEQIDFPLVSIALSYDQFHPLDMPRMMPFIQLLPLFGTLYGALAGGDKRNPADWSATATGQVLMRNGSATRVDYEGKGLMKGMAGWLMREAKLKGFRAIQIEGSHEAVSETWLHPPAPFTAELVASFDTATYEEDGPNGEKVHAFAPAKLLITKIYVTL